MATINFSENWLRKIQPTEIKSYFWDTKQPGLGLRVNKNGHCFFVVQYRIKPTGLRRRISLGRYGALTLEQARQRARDYVSAGLNGSDLKAEQQEKSLRLTFNEIAGHWMDLHVRQKRATRTIRDYEQVLRSYLAPAFGDLPAEEITRAEVLQMHRKMATTPKVANYAVIVGKAAFNFGLQNGFLREGNNPFAGVELYAQEGRERFLSPNEVGRIGDALSTLVRNEKVSIQAAAAIRLLIFTGARKSEILTLQWEWVDLNQSALLLPKSKTGKRRIELNAPAQQVLKSLPRLPRNPFVIVGQKPGQHIVCLAKPWKRICKHAGIKDCRLHDLRHTFASFLAADGHSLLVIGKLLGHTVASTTQRYAHLADDARRRANNSLGEQLGGLLGTELDA